MRGQCRHVLVVDAVRSSGNLEFRPLPQQGSRLEAIGNYCALRSLRQLLLLCSWCWCWCCSRSRTRRARRKDGDRSTGAFRGVVRRPWIGLRARLSGCLPLVWLCRADGRRNNGGRDGGPPAAQGIGWSGRGCGLRAWAARLQPTRTHASSSQTWNAYRYRYPRALTLTTCYRANGSTTAITTRQGVAAKRKGPSHGAQNILGGNKKAPDGTR